MISGCENLIFMLLIYFHVHPYLGIFTLDFLPLDEKFDFHFINIFLCTPISWYFWTFREEREFERWNFFLFCTKRKFSWLKGRTEGRRERWKEGAQGAGYLKFLKHRHAYNYIIMYTHILVVLDFSRRKGISEMKFFFLFCSKRNFRWLKGRRNGAWGRWHKGPVT